MFLPVQRDCQWCMETGGNSHRSHMSPQCLRCNFWKYMHWWHPVSNFVYWHECQCLNIRPAASYLAILVSDWDSWKHMTHVSRRTVVIWESKVMYNLIASQNQGNKISVNQVEGLSIQPVEWWSPWESQLINKGALCLMHPHQWMTAHLHESQTNEGFGKKWENYIEIRYKNFIPLIQKCIIAWYNFQIDFILQKYYMVNQEFVIFFPKLEFLWNRTQP